MQRRGLHLHRGRRVVCEYGVVQRASRPQQPCWSRLDPVRWAAYQCGSCSWPARGPGPPGLERDLQAFSATTGRGGACAAWVYGRAAGRVQTGARRRLEPALTATPRQSCVTATQTVTALAVGRYRTLTPIGSVTGLIATRVTRSGECSWRRGARPLCRPNRGRPKFTEFLCNASSVAAE